MLRLDDTDFGKDPKEAVKKFLRTGLMTTQMFNNLREAAHKLQEGKEAKDNENSRC